MEKIKIFLKKFISNKIKLWKMATAASIVLFLFLAIFVVFTIIKNNKEKFLNESKNIGEITDNSKECADCQRRNLDGIYVSPEKANLRPIAVMIDNHPSARPAFNIDKAGLVYEAEVEGSFTRYMAVFSSLENIGEIGPVRSARSYFVYWAKELGAIYAHCGGSPEALAILADENMTDFNEFYNGDYFWRADSREAPHNVITSGENLQKFLDKQEISRGDFTAWLFKDDALPENRGEDNSEITISFRNENFVAGWRYNREDNNYTRLLAGEIQLTGENNQITAKNIIIQTVSAEVIDDYLRLEMEIAGSGEATICQDGKCEAGIWEKDDLNSRTIFYQDGGEEVEFNAGQTWVEVVRPEIKVNYQTAKNKLLL
jgi:hypothetical protein